MQIAPHLNSIVKQIAANAVVSIVAPTGSGKSVGVPAAIAAAGSRCFVVVPTRTAAMSLAEFQQTLQAQAGVKNVKQVVGYAAEGNVHYTDKTVISYVTGGHARRKMLSFFKDGKASPLTFCDVLMVDEVHSGSIDTTVIISLWMQAAKQGVQVPRLVIASATPVPMNILPTPFVYTVNLQAYPIEIKYSNKDFPLEDVTNAVLIEAAQTAARIHKDTDVSTGHILVFAAGSHDVELIGEKLTEILGENVTGKKHLIIPVFGALKQEEIALIYKPAGPNERKIVIATNIAEMSITISDIGHVVDTLLEKRAETSQSGGLRLATHRISKDSAKQRAGRTGRTRPGICYRLCTEATFQTFEDHRPPEIQRVPIYDTIMELLEAGLNPQEVIPELDAYRISEAIKLLELLGMVNKGTGIGTANKGSVTEIGHFAHHFHVSVRNSTFLWHWKEAGLPLFPGIVLACLIDSYGPSYFWMPRRKAGVTQTTYNEEMKVYKKKFFAKYIGYSDLETSLNMWHDLMKHIGTLKPSPRKLVDYSQSNSLNNKKLRELLTVISQSVHAFENMGKSVEIGPFTTAGALGKARDILEKVYSDLIMNHKTALKYTKLNQWTPYFLDSQSTVNTMVDNPPKQIIALVTAEIKTPRGSINTIGFAVDLVKEVATRSVVPVPTPQNVDVALAALEGIGITQTTTDATAQALTLLEELDLEM